MTIAKKVLKKFEFADSIIVRIPFSEVKNLKDVDDAAKLAKGLVMDASELKDVKVKNVTAKIDGDRKEVVIEAEVIGQVNRKKFIDEIKKLFK